MSDWEPFDDELASALRRRAGSVGDPLATDTAHRAVLSRASGIRRRRAAIAGGGTLTVLLVAGLAVLTTGGEGDDALAPAETTIPGSSVAPVTATSPSTTEESYQHDTGSTVVLTVPPITDAPTSSTLTPSTDPTPETTVSTTTATTADTTSPTTPSTSSTIPSGTPAGDYTYASTGGTIVVRYDGAGTLALVSSTPAAGFSENIEDQQSDRVRVRFDGDGGYSRIECRIVNGTIEPETVNNF